MLRVSDFLSLPHFETFRLIAGSDGLDNIVGGSSVLEWESPKEIAVDFAPNDFVMTTLYMYRDELDRADEALKALIKRRVSAIAIKTTFTDTCSQEILDLAELYKIPIFIYKDAFLEDLIFTIESAVFNDSSNDMALDYLKYLLNNDSGDIIAMARKLNPMFLDNLVCFCLVPADTGNTAALDDALTSYAESFPTRFPIAKSCDKLIRCAGCLLYIHTSKDAVASPQDLMQSLQSRFGIELSSFRVGISHAKSSLGLIKDAVCESVIAAVSASLAREGFRGISDAGSDAFLLQVMDTDGFTDFYRRTLELLTSYDKRHNAGLLDTLICYAESDGDINLTAKKLFQHSNTIRHRLERIKSLMGISSSFEAAIQLNVFSKMHSIRNLFGNEPLI